MKRIPIYSTLGLSAYLSILGGIEAYRDYPIVRSSAGIAVKAGLVNSSKIVGAASLLNKEIADNPEGYRFNPNSNVIEQVGNRCDFKGDSISMMSELAGSIVFGVPYTCGTELPEDGGVMITPGDISRSLEPAVEFTQDFGGFSLKR